MEIKKIIITIILSISLTAIFPAQTFAVNLYFAGQGKINVNENSNLSVMLDTKNESINVAKIKILFDPDYFQVLEIDHRNSVFTFFVPESIDNKNGSIDITAGKSSPGFKGIGEAFLINLKPKKTGTTIFKFDNEINKVLNNSQNKDVYEKSSIFQFEINEKNSKSNIILSPTTNLANDEKDQINKNNNNFIWIFIISNALTLLIALIINILMLKRKHP
jgi:hypothetical protein